MRAKARGLVPWTPDFWADRTGSALDNGGGLFQGRAGRDSVAQSIEVLASGDVEIYSTLPHPLRRFADQRACAGRRRRAER